MNKPTYIAGILQEEALGRGQVFWINKPKDGTHLYTHPAELTDEEIRQCILEYFESPEYKQYPLPVVSVNFARAILRKASEK